MRLDFRCSPLLVVVLYLNPGNNIILKRNIVNGVHERGNHTEAKLLYIHTARLESSVDHGKHMVFGLLT